MDERRVPSASRLSARARAPHDRRRGLRRPVLAAAALLAMAAPMIASEGCGAGFPTAGRIEALRVLAVRVVDSATMKEGKSYAKPGDEVTFEMTYHDGFTNPSAPDAGPRAVEIVWLGGCVDPVGDAYYLCYSQLASLFAGVASGSAKTFPKDLGLGSSFTMTLPPDIVSRRPKPPVGQAQYGIAYVFFAACAGTIKPVPASGDGAAGSFPLGCFDAAGNRLGAESFVPGYTQIYAFADGRPNANPPVNGLTIDGKPAGTDATPVKACAIDETTRDQPASCSRKDPYSTCTTYTIDVDVPSDVAEIDPDATAADGKPTHEAVWVDYFADKGDFKSEIKLVYDPTGGIVSDHSTTWIAPPESGTAHIWAVVRDARGGTTVVDHEMSVE